MLEKCDHQDANLMLRFSKQTDNYQLRKHVRLNEMRRRSYEWEKATL